MFVKWNIFPKMQKEIFWQELMFVDTQMVVLQCQQISLASKHTSSEERVLAA